MGLFFIRVEILKWTRASEEKEFETSVYMGRKERFISSQLTSKALCNLICFVFCFSIGNTNFQREFENSLRKDKNN
jgi:hypothetical protein